jgi:hypothetical protein
LSDVWTIEELRQATSGAVEQYKCLEEKRRQLEKKTKTLEEKARMEKLVVDRNLLVQILEEENHTHDDAVKELEGKIASFEQQTTTSPSFESSQTTTGSEPAQEISSNIDGSVSADAPVHPEESAVQEFQEGPKKKKRSFF